MIQRRKIASFAVAMPLSMFAGIAANAAEVSFDFARTNGTQSASANFTFTDGAGALGNLTSLTITLTNTPIGPNTIDTTEIRKSNTPWFA